MLLHPFHLGGGENPRPARAHRRHRNHTTEYHWGAWVPPGRAARCGAGCTDSDRCCAQTARKSDTPTPRAHPYGRTRCAGADCDPSPPAHRALAGASTSTRARRPCRLGPGLASQHADESAARRMAPRASSAGRASYLGTLGGGGVRTRCAGRQTVNLCKTEQSVVFDCESSAERRRLHGEGEESYHPDPWERPSPEGEVHHSLRAEEVQNAPVQR